MENVHSIVAYKQLQQEKSSNDSQKILKNALLNSTQNSHNVNSLSNIDVVSSNYKSKTKEEKF